MPCSVPSGLNWPPADLKSGGSHLPVSWMWKACPFRAVRGTQGSRRTRTPFGVSVSVALPTSLPSSSLEHRRGLVDGVARMSARPSADSKQRGESKFAVHDSPPDVRQDNHRASGRAVEFARVASARQRHPTIEIEHHAILVSPVGLLPGEVGTIPVLHREQAQAQRAHVAATRKLGLIGDLAPGIDGVAGKARGNVPPAIDGGEVERHWRAR